MLGDVGMVQRGEHFGFALETRQPFGVVCESFRQDLDRDVALEVGVGRAVHLAHAAGANLAGDFIGAEPRARG